MPKNRVLSSPEPVSETTVVLEHPYWKVSRQEWRWPGGYKGPYFTLNSPGSVIVLALDGERLMLTRQYRVPARAFGIEAPGGALEPDEEPQSAAERELREEAGLVASSWTALGSFNPCKGVTDETCHVFLAKDLRDVGHLDADPSEVIERVWVEVDEIRTLIRSGELWDGMTLAALAIGELL